MSEDRVELHHVITNLRKQLLVAQADGEGEALRLRVQDIEVEFQVGVSSGVEGEGSVKFWVLNLGAKGSVSSEAIQKIKLKLKPVLADGDGACGELTDVDLAAEENRERD